jgi:hypothetical protein
MFEHCKAIEEETESGEIGENRVRESDGGNSIELRIIKFNQR